MKLFGFLRIIFERQGPEKGMFLFWLSLETGEQFWNTKPLTAFTRWRCYKWVAFDNKSPDYSHLVLNQEEDQGVGKESSGMDERNVQLARKAW